MQVIFGVQATDRTLRVNLTDDQVKELRDSLERAFSSDAADRILWITDKDGIELAIPVDKLAFVEFGSDKASRQVGFSAAS